ncbi:MAG: acetylornithine/succinyldiaminopimelate transaminase [bacterium]
MTASAAKTPPGNSTTPIDRELYDQVMAPNYAPMTLIPERGEGVRLWDTDGKEYLDFAAGIAVSALGHAHPELCKVLAEQAGKFWHVSNLLTNKPAIDLAHRLCSLTFAERVFFANSGAEVNEAALKLARRYALDHYGEGKTEIISFDNSFHGRTFFTVCVGGQQKYSDGFGPKPGDITHLPFNDTVALEAAVSERTCAVIFEPVQGEGGVNPATEEFVRTARELCDKFNACLIFDEVQTGIGRSGHLFTYEKLGITPDILTSAKGLGGGFPIGAMLTTEAIADSLQVGTHGSTFGGNPMACAVASKVLEIVSDPALLSAVEHKNALFQIELEKLNQKFELFDEVRGDGLLLGCELSEKWKDRARDILTQCTKEGLLILMAGANVLRLAPPLIIEDGDIVAGVAILKRAIESLNN